MLKDAGALKVMKFQTRHEMEMAANTLESKGREWSAFEWHKVLDGFLKKEKL